MAITATGSKLHWVYFLALERDIEVVSRYIEFVPANENVFSIELAHLLFAAASEVDVVSKLICEQVGASQRCETIVDYKRILLQALPALPSATVNVPRHGLSFKPWENWGGDRHPDWWGAYNKVKHERDAHFSKATLKNALNALGGLLILTFHYYSRKLADPLGSVLAPKDTTQLLIPESTFMRLDEDHYYGHLLV